MAAEIRAEPELATAEPTAIWTPGQPAGAVGTTAVPRPHKHLLGLPSHADFAVEGWAVAVAHRGGRCPLSGVKRTGLRDDAASACGPGADSGHSNAVQPGLGDCLLYSAVGSNFGHELVNGGQCSNRPLT